MFGVDQTGYTKVETRNIGHETQYRLSFKYK